MRLFFFFFFPMLPFFFPCPITPQLPRCSFQCTFSLNKSSPPSTACHRRCNFCQERKKNPIFKQQQKKLPSARRAGLAPAPLAEPPRGGGRIETQPFFRTPWLQLADFFPVWARPADGVRGWAGGCAERVSPPASHFTLQNCSSFAGKKLQVRGK